MCVLYIYDISLMFENHCLDKYSSYRTESYVHAYYLSVTSAMSPHDYVWFQTRLGLEMHEAVLSQYGIRVVLIYDNTLNIFILSLNTLK